jgi:7,8-dihydropterin-6-yl-methyl-4-(beta-D-ribofuranosyl)aminobenzene 5'-phosphate synthase
MIDSKKLRLITLSENSAKSLWLLGEWGWSMLIEADGLRLLFDSGLRISAIYNAAIMGIELSSIDRIALSHGHVDHTGGLRDVLERAGTEVGRSNFLDRRERTMEIIAHPDIWTPKYVRYPGETAYGFRGIPFRKEELEERQGAHFVESRGPIWLSEDIVWSGEVPMLNDFEMIAPIFFVKQEGDTYTGGNANFVPDPLNDDAALFLRTEQGLVIVLGCAHRGIINTIHHAQQVTGVDKVHMVVGGTHLLNVSEHQMESTIRELKRLGVKKIGVSHCTGFESASRLAATFGGDVFFYNNAGNVISFLGITPPTGRGILTINAGD